MIVRVATPADHEAIFAVVQAAFGRPAEAHLVERIRASEYHVAELELVATDGDHVVGHVMFSGASVGSGTVLQLSPLAVLPQHQRRGIGSALVIDGLARADGMNEPLVLVEGDPAYYGRFGFERADLRGIEPPPGVPSEPFQVKLLGSYDPSVRGPCRYPVAFDDLP